MIRTLRLSYFAIALLASVVSVLGQSPAYQLPVRAWRAAPADHEAILETLDGICRFSARHQDADGAVIDVYLHREVQYSTPYFAYAVGTLVKAGHSRDLLAHGIAAMEHSTNQFAQGRQAIPDQHGEFFIAALTEALDVYRELVPEEQWQRWRTRLATPIAQIVGTNRNNWMTYAMKGEWLRSKAGLVSHEDAMAFIEKCWKEEQRGRIVQTPGHLYHDRSSDPDTLSVEVVGRGNLLALVTEGYDGPSAAEMRTAVLDGGKTALLLQNPIGELAVNGRTDDHVWGDIGESLAFQVLANEAWQSGDRKLAGQFQEASNLVFKEIQRFKHTDADWAGAFFITKNHFDPALRVGYQDASHIGNYTGSAMFHLAELYNVQRLEIAPEPTRAELGGYALVLDSSFSTVIADAGGMQLQINLRGQMEKQSGNYWTPLGIARISRSGWESRLGPADGALTAAGGVTFAPEFKRNGTWRRMADLSNDYRAEWHAEFVHPALVKGTIGWHPLAGHTGPSFETKVWISPDGVLAETRKTSGDADEWGMTWPLLVNDGRPLMNEVNGAAASTSYDRKGDEGNFIDIDGDARVVADGPRFRSTYGDLLAMRALARDGLQRTFVYPRSAGQPSATEVERSLRRTQHGFTSVLGTVEGDVYISSTMAGGEGNSFTLPHQAKPALVFDQRCGFVTRVSGGRVVSVETDRDVTAHVGARTVVLRAHEPRDLN
jgi:hypothetical protein